MSDDKPLPAPGPSGRADSLHAVARALRAARRLGPEARRALADFLDALDDPETADATPPQMNQLTQKATRLLEALHHQHDAGVLAAARDGLEQAVLRVEAQAPVTAGAFRRLLDALANIGI